MRVDDGEWTTWLTATTATEAVYSGELGHTYTFRVRATDHVGNVGDWAEASTVVVQVTKYYTFGAQRVAMRRGGVVYYLHTDHLGSVSVVSDGSGDLLAAQRYYPYGEVRWSAGTLPTDFTFTGQRVEAGLGLYDYRARYYDPALGRFISADTMVPEPGNPQNLNRYTYAANNPLNHVDPSGHYDLWSGRDNIWGVPEDPVIATHTHSGGYIQLLDHPQSPWNLAERGIQEIVLNEGRSASRAMARMPRGGGVLNPVAITFSAYLYDEPRGGAMVGLYGVSVAFHAYRGSEVAGRWANKGRRDSALTKHIGGSESVVKPASAMGPTRPYNRVRDYGYSPTAAQRRLVNQPGNACVDCGVTVEELHAQGLRMVADHNPPLVVHYYEESGYAMTQAERLSFARSLDSVQPQCPFHSASQGGYLSHLSRIYKAVFGLE